MIGQMISAFGADDVAGNRPKFRKLRFQMIADTNVIVSALLQPLGPPAAVFLLVAGGAVQLCISGDVYAEYEEVIRRPRLARDEEVIAATLQTVREKSLWVRPTETIKACSDSDDDIFLE